jgi:hypothetical protein
MLVTGILAGSFASAPALADSGWIPAHFTCAGISGVMADGNWTHYGAAGLFAGALAQYPFGTILQDGYGQRWTIEDSGPWYAPYLYGRLRIDLYNYFTPSSCYANFTVYDGWVTVLRYGWSGLWLP